MELLYNDNICLLRLVMTYSMVIPRSSSITTVGKEQRGKLLLPKNKGLTMPLPSAMTKGQNIGNFVLPNVISIPLVCIP